MKSFFSWSIRTHLLLLVTLAIIPSLAIALHSGLELRSQAKKEAGDRALRIERTMAFHQELVTENTRQLLMTLAKLPIVSDSHEAACSSFLRSLLQQNPYCANILIADTRGEVFASGLPIAGINISDRQYFREALTNRDFTVGQFAVSRSARKPVIHFAYPVTDEQGRVTAVIVAAFDLTYYGRLLSEAMLPPGSALAITDSRGTRLYRYPESARYFGATDLPEMVLRMSDTEDEGTFIAPGVDGVVRLYAYRRMNLDERGHHLFIRVGIPAGAVAAAEQAALTRNLTLMGAASLLAFLFAWFLGDIFFLRRLIRLVDASVMLGHGKLDTRSGIPHGDGEIGRLANSFDEMAAALEHRERERIQAEEALMESEKRLKLVIQGSNDGFWDWDMKTGEVRHSDRWAEMLGYRPDEIVPCVRSWKSLVHPDDMPAAMQVFREHLDGLRSQYRIEYRMRNKAGEWLWILDRGKVVEWDGNGAPLRMSGTATDISERKRVEEEKKSLQSELLQAQKMEAVGRFASGIAHDFSNILTAIVGYSTLLLTKVEKDELSREYTEQILSATDRGACLTRSILAFSRKQPTKPEPLSLNDLLVQMEKFLSRLIGEDVELRTVLSPLNPIVMADGCQLEQVLMNLATNARDAMPGGGSFSIRSDFLELNSGSAARHGLASPGRYGVLWVSDTGTGIDNEIRDRIFEPFFTTKEMGKGTGLGLAMVYGIIMQHGGHINVSSEPGRGTSFTIYLPAHEGFLAEVANSEADSVSGGIETILLAEDDDIIRGLYKKLLEKKGYKVITAGDGEDAVNKFQEHRAHVKLVILDMVLPKRNGLAAFTSISRMEPGIKAIFMTGYNADSLEENWLWDGKSTLLTKPVHPNTLLSKVRALLDELPKVETIPPTLPGGPDISPPEASAWRHLPSDALPDR
ncbi:MAG: response regulator [Deltaproteobacteria bacterium]|nr:response regulator [Deltaproteobacteria bacterium]